jgi:DNA-binding beta-propeller fold protein YncE
VYVANSLADSITVVSNGSTAPTVAATLTGDFSQPFNLAANPATGKVYSANFGSHNVTVIEGTAINKIVDLGDSTQPYGLAVDETRELLYLSTTDTNRVVVIGPDPQRGPDQFYGWAAFYRGFGDRNRPVPLRNIALNPEVGPAGDGGHLWAVTAVADGSEANQALLIPKGWDGYFHYPLATDLGSTATPEAGVAVDRLNNRVYVSNGGTPGAVTVLGDHPELCPGVAPANDQIPDINRFDYELFSLTALSKGDVTGDGRVDILDMAFIAANYEGENLAADVNRDGRVDIFDLVTAASNYGQQVR